MQICAGEETGNPVAQGWVGVGAMGTPPEARSGFLKGPRTGRCREHPKTPARMCSQERSSAQRLPLPKRQKQRDKVRYGALQDKLMFCCRKMPVPPAPGEGSNVSCILTHP